MKWEPFDEFDRLLRENFLTPTGRGSSMGFDTAIDLYEDDNYLVAEMNVPGLKSEDIDVEVEDNHLRITGRREEVQEKKEKSHYAKEIRRGSFERVVPLPHPVTKDGVTAEYSDGVLKVRMPRMEKAPENRVKVEVK